MLVSHFNRARLLELLDGSGLEVTAVCAGELRSGADVVIYDSESVPASHLLGIYERRARHVRRINLDARGIDEAVERLREAGSNPVGLAIVTGSEHEYVIFVDPDGSGVVACLSVPLKER